MSGTTLGQIVDISGGTLHCPVEAEVLLTEVGLNSAELPEGGLFAALPGTRTHGAAYVPKGAAAVLTDAAGVEILKKAGYQRPVIEVAEVRAVLGAVAAEIYGHPSEELVVIGVTGTSGKTTTSYLLEAGLMACGHKVGLIGTTGTRINLRPVETKLTTPEAPNLQALFHQMLSEGVTHVVMEVSSHAICLGRVDGVRFDAAGFTNLSQDHLDFHPSMEDYFQAKAQLFDPASPLHADKAVVCVDDAWGQKMAGVAEHPITVSSSGAPADIAARDIETNPQGAQDFTLDVPGHGEQRVHLPLPGRFNVANAALAIGLASAVGADTEKFISGLAEVGVPGRMQKIDRGQEFLAIVDYAHKPAAVAAVLNTVAAQVSGRVAAVVGAGGDRDATKRPIMGAEAARRAQLVVITDDNPRSEDPATIRAAVLEGAREAASGAEIVEIGDRREAIRYAINWAQPGDAVVVAGKGHEVGQLIDGVNHHFDDREEVADALKLRGFKG